MWFSLVLTGSSYLYLRRERVRVSKETCIKAGKQQKKKKGNLIYMSREELCVIMELIGIKYIFLKESHCQKFVII